MENSVSGSLNGKLEHDGVPVKLVETKIREFNYHLLDPQVSLQDLYLGGNKF